MLIYWRVYPTIDTIGLPSIGYWDIVVSTILNNIGINYDIVPTYTNLIVWGWWFGT